MEKIAKVEKKIIDHYELIWPLCVKFWHSDKTLGLHYGFYEKGIKTFEEAVQNMNNFVGRHLEINSGTNRVLDAGCGVGGTSTYLAKKYSNVKFTGIELVPKLIDIAKKYAKEKNIMNVEFFLKSYISTGFPDNYFDSVFALLSSSHAIDKQEFIHEMNRVIKPGGKLLVIDIFRTDKNFNFITEKTYRSYLKTLSVEDLSSSDTFINFIKNEGFENIKIQDVSRNIQSHHFQGFVTSMPSFIYWKLRKRKINKTGLTANYYFATAPFYAALVGWSKVLKYYLITATKK